MGDKSFTPLLLIGIVLFALAIVLAAKNNRVIPVGPQPTPSVSASKEK